jgi:hypothetical protein
MLLHYITTRCNLIFASQSITKCLYIIYSVLIFNVDTWYNDGNGFGVIMHVFFSLNGKVIDVSVHIYVMRDTYWLHI